MGAQMSSSNSQPSRRISLYWPVATESLAFAILRDQKESVEVMFCQESWLQDDFYSPLKGIHHPKMLAISAFMFGSQTLAAVWLLFIPLIALSFMAYLKAHGFPAECLGLGDWY
jgi:hypothetical protein